MNEIKVNVKGITPLLMHRFVTEGADGKSTKRTGRPDYSAEAEKALYKNAQGEIYQPSEHLESCLKEAGKQFKISGKRGATYSKLIGSTVEVMPYQVPHLIIEYEIDQRPVVVQRARIIRYRPIFHSWELAFTLRLLDDQLPVEVAKEILDYAGLYVGIGDYRPQKGGKFGKFMVTNWTTKEE